MTRLDEVKSDYLGLLYMEHSPNIVWIAVIVAKNDVYVTAVIDDNREGALETGNHIAERLGGSLAILLRVLDFIKDITVVTDFQFGIDWKRLAWVESLENFYDKNFVPLPDD